MTYIVGYVVTALLAARYVAPIVSTDRSDAGLGAALMIFWPLCLPIALLMWLGERGWDRRK